MSDLMLTAVLSMPYDMAMENEFSRRQFWDRAQQALAEIERLTAELETERMRLTACGVVALANTEQSAAQAREMLPEYRSASLADVERAVDREMQLRAERDELRRQLAEAEQRADDDAWGAAEEIDMRSSDE